MSASSGQLFASQFSSEMVSAEQVKLAFSIMCDPRYCDRDEVVKTCLNRTDRSNKELALKKLKELVDVLYEKVRNGSTQKEKIKSIITYFFISDILLDKFQIKIGDEGLSDLERQVIIFWRVLNTLIVRGRIVDYVQSNLEEILGYIISNAESMQKSAEEKSRPHEAALTPALHQSVSPLSSSAFSSGSGGSDSSSVVVSAARAMSDERCKLLAAEEAERKAKAEADKQARIKALAEAAEAKKREKAERAEKEAKAAAERREQKLKQRKDQELAEKFRKETAEEESKKKEAEKAKEQKKPASKSASVLTQDESKQESVAAAMPAQPHPTKSKKKKSRTHAGKKGLRGKKKDEAKAQASERTQIDNKVEESKSQTHALPQARLAVKKPASIDTRPQPIAAELKCQHLHSHAQTQRGRSSRGDYDPRFFGGRGRGKTSAHQQVVCIAARSATNSGSSSASVSLPAMPDRRAAKSESAVVNPPQSLQSGTELKAAVSASTAISVTTAVAIAVAAPGTQAATIALPAPAPAMVNPNPSSAPVCSDERDERLLVGALLNDL
ncbi:MAG: hypothetical protein M1561_07180 [Gammaproteobacteria bacterium]|nr:hypothetical protein [Gammaproteobacteria bacterium]